MGTLVRDLTTRARSRMLAAIVAALMVVSAVPAAGSVQRSQTVPPVDPYASYEPQVACDPTPKPGVVAFAELLLEAYPVSGSSGISRDCGQGGRSEHKEGRAFDWAVSVSNPQQRAAAEDALVKLLATDEAGNRHALFRRFGLMYIIWDRRIFSASQPDAGWRPYACSTAASFDNCHVNHVHFSFSSAGAAMRTSWWKLTPTSTPKKAPIERLDATARLVAAIEVSRSGFPTRRSSEHVYLARADAPHDAVVAAVMAAASHGAALLTRGGDALEPRVEAEIRRVLNRGGTLTVVGDGLSTEVVAPFADTHQIRRVAGGDHVATARAAALEMERQEPQRVAVLAGADALDEALPMVAVAGTNDWPILFTDRDELSPDTRGLLIEADIDTVYLAGSVDAISRRVRRQLRALDITVKRHAGGDLDGTSVAVANRFFAIPSAYVVVGGDDVARAAVVAAYAGERRHAPVLVTDGRTLGRAATRYITRTRSPDSVGIVVGDGAVLRPQVERGVRRALR